MYTKTSRGKDACGIVSETTETKKNRSIEYFRICIMYIFGLHNYGSSYSFNFIFDIVASLYQLKTTVDPSIVIVFNSLLDLFSGVCITALMYFFTLFTSPAGFPTFKQHETYWAYIPLPSICDAICKAYPIKVFKILASSSMSIMC